MGGWVVPSADGAAHWATGHNHVAPVIPRHISIACAGDAARKQRILTSTAQFMKARLCTARHAKGPAPAHLPAKIP